MMMMIMIHRPSNQSFGSFKMSTYRQESVLELNSTLVEFKIPGVRGLKKPRPKFICSFAAED